MSPSTAARVSPSGPAKSRSARTPSSSGSAKFSHPSELKALYTVADGACSASTARLFITVVSPRALPMRLAASITSLPASRSPRAATVSSMAEPGMAKMTASAPSTAVAMVSTRACGPMRSLTFATRSADASRVPMVTS